MTTTRPTSNWRRLLWEILVLLLLLAIGYGLWTWSEHRHDKALEQQATELTAERDAAVHELENELLAAVNDEATLVARAFGAALEPLALAGDAAPMDRAVLDLLALTGVRFVHVLDAYGNVVVSSDRKLTTTGRAGPRADWALGATGLVQRTESDGIIELAMPFETDDGVAAAYLWMGYDPSRTAAEE